MSYTAITSGEIESGKPVREDTLTKIKDNFTDHESRILAVETGASTVYPPIILRVNGFYHATNTQTNVVRTTCNFNLTITGVRLLIDVAGASGTTEVDVKYKRAAGSWTSVLSTKPTVAFGAGNDAISTNAVLDGSNVDLQAGDLIRLDITSSQAITTKGLTVRIDFNKT